MPASIVRAFTDPDAYHAAIHNAHAEGIITGHGNFYAEWTNIRLDRLSIQRSKESLARVSYSTIDPSVAGFVFPTSAGPPIFVNGLETSQGEIVVYRPGSTGYDRSSAACEWGAIALTHDDLAAAGYCDHRPRPEATFGHAPYQTAEASVVAAVEPASRASGLAKTSPEFLVTPEVARAIEHALFEAMLACLSGSRDADQRGMDRRREIVMQRLEELLQANSDRSLYAAELCAAAGVSYPTLRAFCWEYLGMSPKRYVLLRRMHLAQRALRRADPHSTTVTEIATNQGFWELGRFSGVYRMLFGETPVTTLRRPPEDPRPNKNTGPLWEFIKSA